MLIPEPLDPKLTARCFDVDGDGNIQNPDPAIPTVSCKIPLRRLTRIECIHWNQINYFSDVLTDQWKIIKEDGEIVKASKDAICRRVQVQNGLIGI